MVAATPGAAPGADAPGAAPGAAAYHSFPMES